MVKISTAPALEGNYESFLLYVNKKGKCSSQMLFPENTQREMGQEKARNEEI